MVAAAGSLVGGDGYYRAPDRANNVKRAFSSVKAKRFFLFILKDGRSRYGANGFEIDRLSVGL